MQTFELGTHRAQVVALLQEPGCTRGAPPSFSSEDLLNSSSDAFVMVLW